MFPLELGILSQPSGAAAPTLQQTAKLSFGYNYDPSSAGDKYNVISASYDKATDSAFSLQDIDDTSSGWSYQTTIDFTPTSTNVTGTSDDGMFPEVARDQAYGVDETETNAQFEITGLDDSAYYDVWIHCARAGTSIRLAEYDINGDAKDIDSQDENTTNYNYENVDSVSGVMTLTVTPDATAEATVVINCMSIAEYK